MDGAVRARLTIAAVVAFLTLVASAAPASAHAAFVSSTPAPFDKWNVAPTYVSVTVSEAVQPGSPTLFVTNMTGARVDTGPARLSPTDSATFTVALLPGIGPSVYTVTWSVISADDGHFTAGTFYFMVTNRDGTLPGPWPQTGTLAIRQPISPVEVTLRAGEFAGFSIAFGSSVLAVLLWLPAASVLESADARGPAEGLRSLLRFARLGAVGFAVADAGLWIESLARSPPPDLGAAFSSMFLISLVGRSALGLGMAGLLTLVLMRQERHTVPTDRPPEFLLAIFLGFGVILLEVAASHSAVIGVGWPLGPVADATHLYGAALWVGGLLALLRVRRWLREPTPPAFSREVLAGFSRIALLGALLVVSAGILLAVILVGTLDGLVGTAYGWVILAKGALLVPMVALGFWNRRTLGRGAQVEETPPAVARVARRVRTEAILGAAVLVLAGLLVTISPAASPAPQNPTFTLDARSAGLYAIFQMNPWPRLPGEYLFQLEVYNEANGTTYLQGGNGSLSFLLVGGNGTWVTLPLVGPHGNHYYVQSAVLDQLGTWQVRAEISDPQGTPVDFAYQVTLPA